MITLDELSPRSPIPATIRLILHCSDRTVPDTLSSQPHYLLLMLLTAGESEITLSASNMMSTRDIPSRSSGDPAKLWDTDLLLRARLRSVIIISSTLKISQLHF